MNDAREFRLRSHRILLIGLLLLGVRATAPAGILQDHFGVNPQLALDDGQEDTRQSAISYHYAPGSLLPTKHVNSADYVIDDWYGSWSTSSLSQYDDWSYTGQTGGTHPSGEEPYDVEAMYFDCDETNYYVAVITSFGPATSYTESRASNAVIVAGDLALDFGDKGHNSDAADGFQYDFGVDITDDIRPSSGQNASVASNTPGSKLYKTDNADWYVGTDENDVTAGEERTNFDPDWQSPAAEELGSTTVRYEQLHFYDDQSNEVYETLFETYVVEWTIPRSLLPELTAGDPIRIGWVEGCRNDGNETTAVVRLDATVPEPGTLLLLTIGAGGLLRRRRISTPPE